MQSTLTPQDTDPHDAFVIEPDVVLAARQPSPDPVQELLSHLAHKAAEKSPEVSAAPEVSVVAPTPAVDTTFRATAVDNIDTTDRPVVPDDRPGIGWWVKRSFVAFMFALCSAFAAAAWTHHGAAARQMISSWLPPFVLAALPVAGEPVTDKPAPADQPDAAPVQAAAADQTPAQPASAAQAPVQSSDSSTPAAAASPVAAASPAAPAPQSPSPQSPSTQSPSTQSMAQDLATMGQQIEQLKASIEQLKASQAQMSRDIAKNSEPAPRPRASALPPRPVAAMVPPRPIPAPHKPPRQAYLTPPPVITSPQPTYAAPPPPPPLPQPVASQPVVAQPLVSQPAPVPDVAVPSDDGPVIRPPMPLR
jgi:hypothetical protein